MQKLEGNAYSQLVQMMKWLGYNKDVDIELATVTSIDPLRIKVDNMDVELEGSDLIVSEQLLDHTRKIKIDSQTMGTIDATQDGVTNHNISTPILPIPAPLPVDPATSGVVRITSDQLHFTKIKLENTMLTGDQIELTVYSPLEVGDRLIVASINNNQHYIVIDKAVIL
ncbi:DUF2577 family protein [Longirhabdus pacifica]|uniref:DUF2577 family protein n=1 Tax=Longirhabdus pacifica TaxID=2305227 RepID=UPI001008B4AF|nr:DUF2577 family protein [Longirhabdus pacifica]